MPTSGMPHKAADRLRESMARVCIGVFLKKTPIYQRQPVSAPVKSLGLRRIQSLQRQPQTAKNPPRCHGGFFGFLNLNWLAPASD
jgi:hypothetical protein